jgi:diguanylate cyclase (GGDEF)-like protein
MVTREQEQARLLAENMGPNGRAGRDLAWIVAACTVLVAAVIATNGSDWALAHLRSLSDRNLNGLLALLVILPIGATAFAVRRYNDAAHIRTSLHALSRRDTLTGLHNRQFLGEGFDVLLDEARRRNARIAVLFVDLTGFKQVNDTYGHAVGDQLMIAVADRLAKAIGPDDVVIRYGGDEFVVLCPEVTNGPAAERVAKRLIRVIETPYESGDELLHVSACIGIALTEERCTRPDEVLRDADAAMYQARERGAGAYAMFDRSMRDAITPSTAERKLREALENGEFKLFYQPIVSLWTKRMVGVEALLRWEDPGRGVVSPDEFVGALEDTGLIVPVGSWVIEEACRQAHRWQVDFPDRPPLSVKVNVTARQLAQTDFADTLRHALEVTGVDPDRICIEFTEGAIMQDLTTSWTSLREVKSLGMTLALDDFGTGYSSLSYLRRFSLDLLKIDKTFIDGIGTSREDETIVEHVVAMAKALGIVTVAEGVETEQQADLLRSISCDLAQGYYFSHPQPPHVIDRLMARAGNKEEWQPLEEIVEDGDDGDATAPSVAIPRFRRATVTPLQ